MFRETVFHEECICHENIGIEGVVTVLVVIVIVIITKIYRAKRYVAITNLLMM